MNRCLIHEKSNVIPISPSSPTRKIINEYSLKENFFDPSKSSPPNEFMKKLQERMGIYNTLPFYSSFSPVSKDLVSPLSVSPLSFIKEDNRDIE